ncbi:WDR74 [Symbiodinium natans]|uniref:WDR74 protein n=1 Tax=Symbiodinium natans TaxID=878477 RepID=A0A812RSZ1_9DINO|nr:WDR74 [Symbiodinium natans]
MEDRAFQMRIRVGGITKAYEPPCVEDEDDAVDCEGLLQVCQDPDCNSRNVPGDSVSPAVWGLVWATGNRRLVHVEGKKIERLGERRKGDAIHRLCWAGPADNPESAVAIAYASGALELRSHQGQLLSSATGSEAVRCLQACSSGVLAISSDGTASIVPEWGKPEAFSIAGFAGGAEAEVQQFPLQGPIASASVDPVRPSRFAFGGLENDVKIFDLEHKEVTWTARNVREDSLCLRVPVKVSTLGWATTMYPARSLITCGTSDGKIRVYDANTQRRPLFELRVGYKVGAGAGGWTGVEDDAKRPLLCSRVAHVRGDGWGLFVGDTLGVLREYDLRNLPKSPAASIPPGRKAHLNLAIKQLPFKRGYRGIMGAIRDIDVHCSGKALAAVGLGRFAYVFPTVGREMICKVYLKQKLNCVLMSREEMEKPKKPQDQEEGEEEEKLEEDDEVDLGEAQGPAQTSAADEVEEGFSDDEAEAEVAAEENDARKPARKRRRPAPASRRKARRLKGS